MYQNLYTPLQHLRRPPVQPAGLCWVVFARKADVQYWPLIHPSTNLAFTAIKLFPGKTWYQLLVVNKDRLFTEKQQNVAAGPYWEQTVSGYFGGNNKNQTLAAGIMPFERYVVMFKDRDGNIRMLGSPDSGATYLGDYTSGESDGSRKRTIQFNWENELAAPIYVGDLDDILDDIIVPPFASSGDFTNDFNDDFNNG